MVQYNRLQYLPSEEDLPETDNTPVDNELQLLIPTLLRAILVLLWAERMDWFVGVNLGVYYDPNKSAIGPDGFLSLGVQRFRPSGKLRLSYVIWQENNVVPQWVLEIVSKTPGGEYSNKMTKYAEIGVLYYTIYNPDYWQRDRHDSFEVYRLVNGAYVRQVGNPVWMPELDLGIGYEQGTHDGCTREWLYWYDQQGNRFPAPENVIQQERLRADRAEQRAQRAEQQLEQERLRAEQERLRAEEEQLRAEQERQLREELLNRLRERGINLDDL
jgi:Uma2 family endonuclease